MTSKKILDAFSFKVSCFHHISDNVGHLYEKTPIDGVQYKFF